MKILIIHNEFQKHGGEDQVVWSEKKLLEDQGHEVIYFSRNNDELFGYDSSQKLSFYFKDVYFSQKIYTQLSDFIKEKNPDVIHIHNVLYLLSPAVYQACYDSGKPIVQSLHNFRIICPIGTCNRRGEVCHDCKDKGTHSVVVNKCFRDSYVASFMLGRTVTSAPAASTP